MGGRILVLDDEEPLRSLMKRILQQLGYSVECVSNSDQAVEKYRRAMNTKEAFDAVILDLTVPGGKGGKDAIVELKKIDPAVRAVVSSGYSNDDVVVNFRDYGFSSVLPKPYTIEEVSESLNKVLA